MKYTFVLRDPNISLEISKNIEKRIIHQRDDNNPDLIVVIGGDGTILRAIRKYFDRLDRVVFYGINTGHLGFYTNWVIDEYEDFINAINNYTIDVEEFPLLEATINGSLVKYALNEITIRNNYVVEEFDVYIDNLLFEKFRGTGICISTASGSTAFNKSLGGSVLDTDLEGIQLSEIASINSNAYRTLGSSAVFSSRRKIEIKNEYKNHLMFTADQEVFELDFENVIVKLSNKKVSFAINKSQNFWDRVKKSFI